MSHNQFCFLCVFYKKTNLRLSSIVFLTLDLSSSRSGTHFSNWKFTFYPLTINTSSREILLVSNSFSMLAVTTSPSGQRSFTFVTAIASGKLPMTLDSIVRSSKTSILGLPLFSFTLSSLLLYWSIASNIFS